MTGKKTNWREFRLGRILRYLDERVLLKDEEEYLTITVKRRHGGLEMRERLLGRQIATKKQFKLAPGAFIISRIQCWHQAYAIVGDVPPNAIASSNYDQFAISPEVDARFFWWLSYSPEFTASVRSSASGVVIEKMVFDRDDWLTKSVWLPPLAEQQRMVARIEELADQIHAAQTLRQQSAQEAEAFIVSLHTRLAGERTRKLGEILTLDEHSVRILPTGSYPQVGVRSFGGGLFPKSAVEGTETTYGAFNQLYEGALVLSQVKGWEGAVAVCPVDLANWFVSPEYRTFRCVPTEARSDYLAPLVRTEWFWRNLANATRGVGARRERTRPEQFLEIELPMPDLEQQKRGAELFAQVNGVKRLQAETTADLDALLPSLLSKVFAGQL
jgi:type I restriction enzyme S subunit